MLGEKCVIIEAPNLDTKIVKNQSSTWKMTKKDQKLQNTKNSKIEKIKKVSKSTKSENAKTWKSTKLKSTKNDQKKWQKVTPPSKWPKCHLNDQNRHFVISEPPGPAFFRFQGVPRDPVLRPDLDPPYFSPFLMFWDCIFHILCISHFIIFTLFDILWFTHFHHFINLRILWFS